MRKRALLVLSFATAGLLATNIPASARAHGGHRVVVRAAPSASTVVARRLASRGVIVSPIAGARNGGRIVMPAERRAEGLRGEAVRGAVGFGTGFFGWPYYADYVDFLPGDINETWPEVIVIPATQDGPAPAAEARTEHGYFHLPDGAARPEVIVITGTQSGEPPPALPALGGRIDNGYIAGCHAIPGGYHCDEPRREDGAH